MHWAHPAHGAPQERIINCVHSGIQNDQHGRCVDAQNVIALPGKLSNLRGRSACAQVSTPYTAETVESAQALLVVGPLFNDYNTVGFTSLITAGERSVLSRASRGM